MRREGQLRGKPTSRTRQTGKCKRPRCRHCHTFPVTKSMGKAKGESKTKIRDVTINHLFYEWPACDKKNRCTVGIPSLRVGSPSTMWTNPDYGEEPSDWSDTDDAIYHEEVWSYNRASNESTADLVVSLLNAVAALAPAVPSPPTMLLHANDSASDVSMDSDIESEYEKIEVADGEVRSESDESWCAVNLLDALSDSGERIEGEDEAWVCF